MDYPRADQYGRPIFADPETGEDRTWTRASTVGKALSDGAGLINWTGAMVAAGAYLQPELAGQVGARWPMTDDNKGEIYKIVEKMKEAGGGPKGANIGDTLHEMFKRILRGEQFSPMPPWDADINAGLDLLDGYGITVNPDHVERTVCLPRIGVAGTADFYAHVAGFGDDLLVGDFKTGKVGDYSWVEWVCQLTLYAHADWMYRWETGAHTPMPPVNKRRALIVHVPAGQARAELYVVDIAAGRKAVKAALWVRDWRKRARSLARPARPLRPARTGTDDY